MDGDGTWPATAASESIADSSGRVNPPSTRRGLLSPGSHGDRVDEAEPATALGILSVYDPSGWWHYWGVTARPAPPNVADIALSIRTLLFSDIEGSTSLVDRAGNRYPALLSHHRRIVRAAVERAGGIEHSTEGDSFFLTFDSPTAGLAAAVEAQRAIETYEWPEGLRVRVRMGLHVGEVLEDDDDLVGMSINHAARIAASAHGGQIVLSGAVRDMIRVLPDGVEIHPLGTHRLRDVGSVSLFQVDHPDLQHEFPTPRGVVGYRTNLPRSTTPFIGGEELLAAIGDQLRVASLVTLTGTGGVGKTRAAIEFGHRHLAEFDHGVFFVDLAPVTGTGAVVGVVASTLPILAGGEQLLRDTIVDWVGEHRVLLVIDNCEHLVGEVSALVDQLITRCSNLQILATSREALGVHDERVHRVPSLEPDGAAVELFCERALATDETFAAEGHLDAVVRICERVDGIPLAIELAAARMRSLSAEELLERLQDRFRVLRGSGRSTLDRHQTLRATVSWSYQLLTDAERLFFDRASVFAGGFDLRAAEAVCGFDPIDDIDVIDLVGSLVDKSMIVADRGGLGMRYRLLETLRQYGEEQLELRGATTLLRDRLLTYFVELAERLDTIVRGARQVEGSLLFEREWDNVRAAHGWAIATGNITAAEDLVRTSWQHAQLRMLTEHADWVEGTIAIDHADHPASTELFGIAADWAGGLGDEEHAVSRARAGLARAKALDDPSTCLCWYALDGADPMPGEPDFGHDVRERLRRAVEHIDNPERKWNAVADLVSVGMAEVEATRFAQDLDELRQLAGRVKAPALVIMTELISAHVEVLATPPDLTSAHRRYSASLQLALATNDIRSQGWASRGVATTATALRRPDALTICHDALLALADMRYWQKVWQTLDTTVIALLDSGRKRQATTILGYLETQPPNIGLENWLGFRRSAIERTRHLAEATEWMQRGSECTRDGIVDYALASTRPT